MSQTGGPCVGLWDECFTQKAPCTNKLSITTPQSVDLIWQELPLFYNVEVSANERVAD